jgi:hypothetical protein
VDFEETLRRSMVGYDEKTETWYLRARESQRLMLTRQSLNHLVTMYNGIHQGRPLVLLSRSDFDRLEEARREQAELLDTLHRRHHRRATGIGPTLLCALRRFLSRRTTRLPGGRPKSSAPC